MRITPAEERLIVRLRDLTTDQQRLLVALMDAAKSSPRSPLDPYRIDGTTSDKEKVSG